MEEIVNQLLALLAGVNPGWAALAVIVVAFLRNRGWLKMKLPNFSPAPSPTPDVPDPLKDNPLLKRLLDRVRQRFAERVLDDGEDEDEVYVGMMAELRTAPDTVVETK